MKNLLNRYFTAEYLWAPITEARYDKFYLGFSIVLIVLPLLAKVVLTLKFKNRPKKVYGTFDKIWFWTSLSLGFIGVFIWFSRVQSLPMFGTHLASYIYLFSIPVSAGLIFWYFKAKIPERLTTHYEKARKQKYLK